MLLSAGDIIRESVGVYRTHAKRLLAYATVVGLPYAILSMGASMLGLFEKGMNIGTALGLMIGGLVVMIIAIWGTAGLTRAIATIRNGGTAPTVGVGLQEVKHLIWPIILVSIITALGVLAGFLLFIIPGIIFSVWYAFGTYAVIIDNHGAGEAMTTSKKLVAGRWWSVVWRLLAPALVFGLLSFLISLVVTLPASFLLVAITPGSVTQIFAVGLMSLLEMLLTILIVPLSTAAPTILYLDLKKTPLPIGPPLPPSNLSTTPHV